MESEFEGLREVRNIRRAFARTGVVKIGGFLSADMAARLAKLVDESYRIAHTEVNAGREVEPDIATNLLSWNGLAHECLPAFLSRVAPALETERAALTAAIGANVQRLFGPRWHPVQSRSFFRRLEPGVVGELGVPWHIDADAARTVGFGKDTLNVWLPLIDVGRHAPSLEFVPGSHRLMRRIPLMSDGDRVRSDDWVQMHADAARLTAQAGLGDALIFGQHVLHRTQPGIGGTRTSCEFRYLREPGVWNKFYSDVKWRVQRRIGRNRQQ